MPQRGRKSKQRQEHERQSWFRAGQEGTISLLKRRYGMRRTRYRGGDGSRRWVGGAIWGYNLQRIAALL